MRHYLICLVLAGSAAADVLHLQSEDTEGKALVGIVTDEGERYTVINRDRKYVVRKTDVVKHEQKAGFMEEYGKRLAALPADDADAIYEFGLWLIENDWATRAHRAFAEVIRLDTDHRAARRALGYKRFEGVWVSPAELNRRRGLIEFEDEWYTKHELETLKKRIKDNDELRRSRQKQKRVWDRVRKIVPGFQSFDTSDRETAHEKLSEYAEQLNSPELRKFADDVKAYYDHQVAVLCASMIAKTTVQAAVNELQKPINTFETDLGQSVGTGARLTFASRPRRVTIQLPEMAQAQVKTSADIPAGCFGGKKAGN